MDEVPATGVRQSTPSGPRSFERAAGKTRVLALVWILCYLVIFYSTGTQDGESRAAAVCEMIAEAAFPPARAVAQSGAAAALGQRLWMASIALVLVVAALGWGYLVLRVTRVAGRLTRSEQAILSYGAGTAVLSLVTLLTGAAGLMQRSLHLALLLSGPSLALAAALRERHASGGRSSRSSAPGNRAMSWPNPLSPSPLAVSHKRSVPGQIVCLVPAILMVGLIFTGATLPPDGGHQYFDVKEYHLQAPKEFFLQGRVTFLEHNVYASMPLGTEMLSLLAMIVTGDWWWGALVGQTVLATFAPATAVLLFVAGRRFFGPAAGAIAPTLYLGTPAIFEVSTTAYVEGGLCFYMLVAVYAWAIARGGTEPNGRTTDSPRVAGTAGLYFLAGWLAGAAAGCKYPGAAYVVLPLSLAWVLPASGSSRSMTRTRGAAVFLAGALLAFAPWLARNVIDTGNPVYPLLWSVFGGRGWSAGQDARWWQAHAPPAFTLGHLAAGVWQVGVGGSGRSALNPLLIGFAALAFGAPAYRRSAVRLGAIVLFVLVVWWSATHRIDRFWYPVLPLIALLAGAGGAWFARRVSPGIVVALVVASLFVVAAQCVTRHPLWSLFGWRLFALDVIQARDTFTKPQVAYLNHELPYDGVVLAVGEAAVFDFERTVFYATAFNDRMFDYWLGEGAESEFARMGITHVYVDWAEISRYRGAGNYGFTDAVSQKSFEHLVRRGLLGEPIEFDQWAQRLGRRSETDASSIVYALYPVPRRFLRPRPPD